MNRRAFLLLGTSAAVGLAPHASAEGRRIGFLAAASRATEAHYLQALRDGLRGFGWSDGANVAILERWAEEQTEHLPLLAEQLIEAPVDLLVVGGTPALLAAATATAKLPIVMVGIGDPVALGVANSLAEPGGNVTGLSLNSQQLIVARLRLLQELIPALRRVAVIVRDDPDLEQKLWDIRATAYDMGLALLELEATTGQALNLSFRRLRNDPCDAIYVASGPLGPFKRARMLQLAAEARLPAIYCYRIFALGGGLMSLAPDETDLFRRAAGFVDRILRGQSPARMAIEQPAKSELIVNLAAARALGLAIPPAILTRADAVLG